MTKPIGNQVANLKSNDKVSFKVKQKFLGKSDGPGFVAPEKQGERQKPKFKTRKK
jgi:hypothetical protein